MILGRFDEPERVENPKLFLGKSAKTFQFNLRVNHCKARRQLFTECLKGQYSIIPQYSHIREHCEIKLYTCKPLATLKA